MEDITKLSILLIGLILIGFTGYYFYSKRGKNIRSISFFVVLLTSIFLIIITFYPDFIIGMKISEMNFDTALNYQSMIFNLVLGFSAVIGIGISLVWEEKGEDWRRTISFILIGLMFYFIYVMYMVFLRELILRIAELNI